MLLKDYYVDGIKKLSCHIKLRYGSNFAQRPLVAAAMFLHIFIIN